MIPKRRIAATLSSAALVLSLAACAQTVAGSPIDNLNRPSTPHPSSSTPSSSPSSSPSDSGSPTGFPKTSSSAPSSSGAAPSGPLSTAQVKQALLTQQEVGGGFTAKDDTDNGSGGACPGTEDPDKAVPPAAFYGRDFTNAAERIGFTEEIESYASSAMASSALRAIATAYGCGKVTDSGQTLILTGPTDVSADLGVDQASYWGIVGSNLQASLVVAHNGADLVGFEFVNANWSSTVVKAGIAKDTAAH